MRRIDGKSDELVKLSALTRVGRASDNEIVIDDARVSQVHASIAWTAAGVWELRDHGSSNGTFVDGVRLDPGERRALGANARVSFGVVDPQWLVVDVDRPCPEARDVATGERHVGAPHMLSLPAADEATVDIVEESRGAWVVEAGGVARDVRHGEVIDVGGRRYRVSLPLPIPETENVPGSSALAPALASPLGSTTLTLLVSADRESVELHVEWAGRLWTTSKAYTRGLLVLAEARVRDERSGMRVHHDHGWMYADEICTQASYESVNRLNVEVHRARADLSREGVPGAPAIIQRRRGTGQMRIGTNRISIVRSPKRGS